MKFQPLALIELRHSYYADGRCPDFHIQPTAGCVRLLRNHRLVMRSRRDGVLIVAPVGDQDTPFIPFRPDMTLAFHLRLENPDFPLFTGPSAPDALAAPVYSNGDRSAGELTLVSRPESPAAPRPGRDDFAGIEIRGVDPGWLTSGPATFHVAFTPRQARWAYYFVTDINPSQGELHIVDNEGDPATQPLVFSDHNRTDLAAAPDPSDTLASDLARQYPRLRRLRFVSDHAIPFRQASRKQIELHLGGERLQGALPNPSPRNYATLELDIDGVPQRQDSLFQVVKYITHQEL
jgi:hypothetical protein